MKYQYLMKPPLVELKNVCVRPISLHLTLPSKGKYTPEHKLSGWTHIYPNQSVRTQEKREM